MNFGEIGFDGGRGLISLVEFVFLRFAMMQRHVRLCGTMALRVCLLVLFVSVVELCCVRVVFYWFCNKSEHDGVSNVCIQRRVYVLLYFF